jgi:hypothetical protein
VSDQDQGAGKFGQTFLEHVQGRNVQIVGGFVEQEDVGGLEHQPGNEDPACSPPESRWTGVSS